MCQLYKAGLEISPSRISDALSSDLMIQFSYIIVLSQGKDGKRTLVDFVKLGKLRFVLCVSKINHDSDNRSRRQEMLRIEDVTSPFESMRNPTIRD
jgi:hypothetical protein